MAVQRDVAFTQIEAASDVTLDVSGRLIGGRIAGDEGTNVQVDVDLDVIASTVAGFDESATLNVGRNLISSVLNASGVASITVGGSMSASQLYSGEDDVSLSVTGNITRSTITSPESNVSVSAGGNFVASSVTCDEDMTISIGGNLSGLLNSFDSEITLTVGGTMSGKAVADDRMLADIGQLTGSLSSNELDLIVQGNVTSSARIQTGDVDDFNGDTFGFRVDGTFAGVLNAINFDSDVVGGSTIVAGDVLRSARFNIAGTIGETIDELFSFGGDFLGVLNIGGDIDVDIAFDGNVNQVIIGGLVGVAGAVNTITVGGKLKFLSSGSLFDEITSGLTGSFENGVGTVTGTLVTQDGFVTVTPTA
jgi:hypothetical protein